MSDSQAPQKTTEVSRPRSSQMVSVNWNDATETDAARGARLQFEIAECVETKTVTTTTTTKRSYPPLYVREPRTLQSLDAKEYPLASKPTPPELSKFSFDLDDGIDSDAWSSFDDSQKFHSSFEQSQDDHLLRSNPFHRHPPRARITDDSQIKSEPGVESPPLPRHESPPQPASSASKQPADSSLRRSTRSSSVAGSPVSAISRKVLRSSNNGASASTSANTSTSTAAPDRPRRLGLGLLKDDRDLEHTNGQSSYLATPDNSGIGASNGNRSSSRFRSLRLERAAAGDNKTESVPSTTPAPYEAASPTGSDAHTVFSTTVATPPIADADADSFPDADESLQQTVRALPPRVLGNVGILDASLPSPRLSPTLSAVHTTSQLHDDDHDELDDRILRQPLWMTTRSQSTEIADSSRYAGFNNSFSQPDGTNGSDGTMSRMNFMAVQSMLERFDTMPTEIKTFMMYQFLRRCPRKTLQTVADVVNPALKCDFLKQLPLELSLHVLSYLDFKDMCRAAQVSKHWRIIVDSNETGWKELLDRDGFELPSGELQRAISQGWGWQDPVGAHGCEVDLSLSNRMEADETDLIRSSKPESSAPPRVRTSKRKRGITAYPGTERSKRRASAQEAVSKEEKQPSQWPQVHKSEGPISAASAAAAAIPNPKMVNLPSLRNLHLFKSLYRRHHMIRQNWTSGKVKPQHLAFTAHPRHVITCLQFDDDKIITGSDDTLIHIYDTKTGKLLKKLEGHEGGVWALQYEGNVLVSGSTDRSVRVWDIEKGLCTQVFYGHTSTVRCLQILMPKPTGKFEDGKPVMMPPKPLIITGSRDNQLRVWRLPEPGSRRYIQTGPPANDSECPYFIRILSGHTSSVRSIAAHGDILVSGSYDSTVRVWRISTGESLHVLQGHTQRVYSVVLDTKRNRCISGSMDSLVKIWDLDTGACLHTLEGHALLVGLLELRDEKLVSAAADSTLRVWDPETGTCKSTLTAHTGAITCFQHDGRKVISGSEKTVKMWDIQTGECIQDLLSDLTGVWQVKFDARRCVAAVQRDNLTYIEILDFGAVRDSARTYPLGVRTLLNAPESQSPIEEEL